MTGGFPAALAAGGTAPSALPAQVVGALAVILVVARASGAIARRVGQPAVVGEIVAGLALGPSLLGLLPGDLPHVLFPAAVHPVLGAIAQLGLVLFMFLVGLEADPSLVRGQARVALSVSLGSIALPFALGVPLALVLHSRHGTGAAAHLLPFVLFIGASLSITAFPVLARILTERRMDRTPLGTLALATAALDDVIAWSMLAVVVAIVLTGSALGALGVAAGAVAFSLVLALGVRPLAARLAGRLAARPPGRDAPLSAGAFALVLVGVLAAAWTTDAIGVHLVFGAFAFGVFFPADPALREAVAQRVEAVTVLLLPVFFVVTGLDVDLSTVSAGGLGELALILLVAVGGKVGGAFVAARLHGVDGRRSLALGLLANTRGLTELVILGVGRQLGVLDGELFGLLVVMALVTTAMAGPLLDAVYPDRFVQRDLAGAQRGGPEAMTVVTGLPGDRPAGDADHRSGDADHRSGLRDGEPPADWASLLAVSADLARSAGTGHVLLSRVLPLPPGLGVGSLALLAAETGRADRAARTLAGPGVTAAPTVVRADDPVAELHAQVRRVDADWVVVPPGTPLHGSPADTVLVAPGPAPRPGAVLLQSPDAAAWDVATRLAVARGVPLQVVSGSRAAAAARDCGARVSTLADGTATVIVVGPEGGARAATPPTSDPGSPGAPPAIVTVLPGAGRPQGLAERAARIPAPDSPQDSGQLIEEHP